MLNLLISIIGNTYSNVSAISEFVYTKNRMLIMSEFLLSNKKDDELMKKLKDKYLITLFRLNSEIKESNLIQEEFKNINSKIEVIEERFDRKIESLDGKLKVYKIYLSHL